MHSAIAVFAALTIAMVPAYAVPLPSPSRGSFSSFHTSSFPRPPSHIPQWSSFHSSTSHHRRERPILQNAIQGAANGAANGAINGALGVGAAVAAALAPNRPRLLKRAAMAEAMAEPRRYLWSQERRNQAKQNALKGANVTMGLLGQLAGAVMKAP